MKILKACNHPEWMVWKVGFLKFRMFIILLNLVGCSAEVQETKLQGQEAILTFPYPCDSNLVTLQQSNHAPFFRSTDISSLSLHSSQVGRFRVQNRNDSGSCSLELTIHDLKRYDQGAYISLVYKDGHILQNAMQKIHLFVDYPPGKALCVVGEDKGRGWVSIDCTASAGSLTGDIECYQNGVWLPPYLYIEIDAPLNQTFLIRKAQPTFCCSILLGEYKERCQCNDVSLYLSDGDSNDPCPTPVKITTEQTIVTQYNQSYQYFNTTSSLPTEKYRNTNQVVLWSASISTAAVLLLLACFMIYCHMKKNACEYFSKICNLINHPDPEEPYGMEQIESFL